MNNHLVVAGAIAFLLLFGNTSIAQVPPQDSISKHTYVYAIKDSNELGLDVYSKAGRAQGRTFTGDSARPCVIFVFGGAFVGGRRDDTAYLGYFHTLAAHQYTVLSISYRLGLKGVRHLSKFNTAPLRRAIDMAVEDTYDATAWAIAHAGLLGIDTDRIILCGSSSGAITVLEALSSLWGRKRQIFRFR